MKHQDFPAQADDLVPVHHEPRDIHDRIAFRTVKVMRFFADKYFAKRYAHRAVALVNSEHQADHGDENGDFTNQIAAREWDEPGPPRRPRRATGQPVSLS